MSKTYDEWLKYYSNGTKEEVIEDLMLDNLEIERLHFIINDLYNGLEKIIEQGYDYNEKDKIAIELINKIEILNKEKV